MLHFTLYLVIVSVGLPVIAQTTFSYSPCTPSPDNEKCHICNHAQGKRVTIRAKNILKEPKFDVTVRLSCTHYKTLYYMLQEAANVNPALRFTASYFDDNLGFYIDAINSVYGTWDTDKSYWEILDGNMHQTPVGASSYVPKNGERVTFNLTTG